MGSMNSFPFAGMYPISNLFFHMRGRAYVTFRHFLGFLSCTCLLFHSYYVLTFQTPTMNNLRNRLVFVLILTRIELIFFLVADSVFWI